MQQNFAYTRVWAALGLICLVDVQPTPTTADGIVTVAMTASDIPLTTGHPDQGAEGFRFIGWNLYDALVNWDLSKSVEPGRRQLVPLRRRRRGKARHRYQRRVRRNQTPVPHQRPERTHERPGRDDLGRPRREPTRAVTQTERLRPGPKLAPGPHADHCLAITYKGAAHARHYPAPLALCRARRPRRLGGMILPRLPRARQPAANHPPGRRQRRHHRADQA